MHYFIVRSQNKLAETLEKFHKYGYPASGISVLDIHCPKFTLPAINHTQGFIFTSQYGVDGLMQSLSKPKATYHAFCIGQSTEDKAKRAGFTNIHIPACANGIALAELIKNYNMPFIYAAGCDRKPYLEENLKRFKISYDVLETYNALPINQLSSQIQKNICQHKQIAFICFSVRNAVTLYRLMQKSSLLADIAYHSIWHIVGNVCEIDIDIQNCYFYETPQRVYEFFSGKIN